MIHARSAAIAAVSAVASFAATANGQFVFEPGTPQEVVARYQAAFEAQYGSSPDRYIVTQRWPGNEGEPISLIVSFAPDGVQIPPPPGSPGGPMASSLFTTLDGQFANVGGRTRWQTGTGGPKAQTQVISPIEGGGIGVWRSAAAISFNHLRRTTGANSADNPAVNNWDTGVAWGTAGPLNSPRINVTIDPAQITAFRIDIATDSKSLSVTSTPGGITNLDFTTPAFDTLGEVTAAIDALANVTATLSGSANASASSSTILVGPSSIALNGTTFSGTLNTTTFCGDIRIGMRPLDDSILAFVTPPGADGGDIVLNANKIWTGGSNLRILRNTIARSVGSALGLATVCPSDGTKLMEPVLNTSATIPLTDDIRGAHRLFGDVFPFPATGTSNVEPNDSDLTSWRLPNVALVSPPNFTIGLSLDNAADLDFIRISIPPTGVAVNLSAEIVLTPVGGTYNVGPLSGQCVGTPFNASAVYDLQGNIFTVAGDPLAPGSPASTGPFTSFINGAAAGLVERFTVPILDPGDYFLVIKGSGAAGPESQLYNLQVAITNLNLIDGVALGPISSDFINNKVLDGEALRFSFAGPTGHGALTAGLDSENQPFFYNNFYDGRRARYATVEGSLPDGRHTAFEGRTVTSIPWLGLNPAFPLVGGHPTAVTGAAAGRSVLQGQSFFRGIAPGAQIFASNVGSAFPVGPDGPFAVSPEAVYFSTLGISDPQLAGQAGLTQPVTVINSSYGGEGDLTGDSFIAHAYDAAVSMTGVTIVVAAGNSGRIDNTSACNGEGGDIPGGDFAGARTVGSPATAFNVLSVGAVGKGFGGIPEEDGGDVGGGGGGGGRPANVRGGQTPTPEEPRLVNLNTVVNFSSKGPADAFDFTSTVLTTQFNTRPGVHILAAGTGLVRRKLDPALLEDSSDPCTEYLPGHDTIADLSLPLADSVAINKFEGTRGTSFAAPVVAGAVALLQDYGLAQLPPMSIDSLVMRAVLMNSAIKLPGWSNNGNPGKPQDNRDGRLFEEPEDGITERVGAGARPLDVAQGAGVLSIPYAFVIYAQGDQRDIPLTDPLKPTQTPADEIPAPPFPGNPNTVVAAPSSTWTPEELAELRSVSPVDPIITPVQFANVVQRLQDLNSRMVYAPSPDFTDPDLAPGGGGKSGAGTFTPREAFGTGGTSPGAFQGDGPPPKKPIILPGPLSVGRVGWDIANLGIKNLRLRSGSRLGGQIDYQFVLDSRENALIPMGHITATLVWNRTITVKKPTFQTLDNPQVGDVLELELENLDLELYATPTGRVLDGQEPIAFSRSTFNNVEHIHFRPLTGGIYTLRVTYNGRHYNFFRNLARGAVKFAIAWAYEDDFDARYQTSLNEPPDPEATRGLPLLSSVLVAYGSQYGDPHYNVSADMNADGRINTADLIWVITHMPGGSGVNATQ